MHNVNNNNFNNDIKIIAAIITEALITLITMRLNFNYNYNKSERRKKLIIVEIKS